MMMKIADFCVNELLWLVAWGSYQLSFGLIFTWLLFILMGRLRALQALCLTVGSYAFAIVTFFGIVSCLFINYFQWKYIGGTRPNVLNPLDTSLFLGGILSLLQAVFYLSINYWRPFFVLHFFILSLISNIAAAVCASYFIRLTL